MKRYLNRHSIFAVLFIVMLFTFAIKNINQEYPILSQTLQGFKNFKDTENLKATIKDVDKTINDQLLWKKQFMEGYGYIQVLIGKNEFNNFDYVKDNNGFLNYASLYDEKDPLIGEYAKRIVRLKNSVEKKGTKVIFISPPSKSIAQTSENSEELNIKDHNLLQNEFLLDLHNNEVDYLDLRKPLLNSNIPKEELFFKTDHHWTSQSAFVSFSAIVEKMKSLYGVDLDPNKFYTNLDNYNQRTYKNNLLGSQGRDTGINYSGLDDFTLIWPKFPTNFTYDSTDNYGEKVHKEGSFEQSLLKSEALYHESDIYEVSSYESYIDGIRAFNKIVNLNNPKGPKILMIRDSFSNPVESFLAPVCSEIHAIWPLAKEGKVDVEEYLKDNKFDYVFVMLYPGNINESGINFFKKK
ncbi:DHHW family protein [Clostridium sp. SHJSY1]|uniref:DHHW family protein n=1 Tax=Clostridium sp. SHJSY1 TaxID=2942483 RepID=UPI0028754548|nr:DHHW family protein [Clostridium sp. SHJSY1]MDS0525430.1 DHHW family protein [Clostridium sp. SHJSY1]